VWCGDLGSGICRKIILVTPYWPSLFDEDTLENEQTQYIELRPLVVADVHKTPFCCFEME
jgi:hypothetical protein